MPQALLDCCEPSTWCQAGLDALRSCAILLTAELGCLQLLRAVLAAIPARLLRGLGGSSIADWAQKVALRRLGALPGVEPLGPLPREVAAPVLHFWRQTELFWRTELASAGSYSLPRLEMLPAGAGGLARWAWAMGFFSSQGNLFGAWPSSHPLFRCSRLRLAGA